MVVVLRIVLRHDGPSIPAVASELRDDIDEALLPVRP